MRIHLLLLFAGTGLLGAGAAHADGTALTLPPGQPAALTALEARLSHRAGGAAVALVREGPSVGRLLEMRRRVLTGPQPPDPRGRLVSSDVGLRLPLGDRVDLHPGLRLDRSRDPVDDGWDSEWIPAIGITMRF